MIYRCEYKGTTLIAEQRTGGIRWPLIHRNVLTTDAYATTWSTYHQMLKAWPQRVHPTAAAAQGGITSSSPPPDQ